MKKYKNKNTGEVVKSVNSIYYMTADEIGVPKRFIEDSCDWEEVKEQTYEIISFSYKEQWGEGNYATLNNQGNYATLNNQGSYTTGKGGCWTLNNLLEDGVCVKTGQVKIHSVKRLSDGEIFTLGDKAKYAKYGTVDIISSLRISSCGGSIYVATKGFSWGQLIEDIDRVKPFFITYDGVAVEEDTEVFWTVKNVYKYSLLLCDLHLPLLEESEAFKVFSTEEEAKKYQRSVIPTLFLTEDGVDIVFGSTYWCVNTAPHLWSLFEQTAKERTKLNNTVKAFSTKELAEAYLLRHKPLLSLDELLSVWSNERRDEFYSKSRLFLEFQNIAKNKLK